MTAVMISLCHPVTGNLSHYFRVPDYMSVNLAELKSDLCDIDFMKIESEMTSEFNFMEIVREVCNYLILQMIFFLIIFFNCQTKQQYKSAFEHTLSGWLDFCLLLCKHLFNSFDEWSIK